MSGFVFSLHSKSCSSENAVINFNRRYQNFELHCFNDSKMEMYEDAFEGISQDVKHLAFFGSIATSEKLAGFLEMFSNLEEILICLFEKNNVSTNPPFNLNPMKFLKLKSMKIVSDTSNFGDNFHMFPIEKLILVGNSKAKFYRNQVSAEGFKLKELTTGTVSEDETEDFLKFLESQSKHLKDLSVSEVSERVGEYIFIEMYQNLKKLAMFTKDLPSYELLSCLKPCTSLEELVLIEDHIESAELALALFNHFPSLKRLEFRAAFFHSRCDPMVVKKIRLPNLKELKVCSTRNALLVNVKLESLESLEVGNVIRQNDWIQNVKNIEKLKIRRFQYSNWQKGFRMDLSMTEILKAFPKLRHLGFGFGMYVSEAEAKTMKLHGGNLEIISSVQDFWIFSKTREESLRDIDIKQLRIRSHESFKDLFGENYLNRLAQSDDAPEADPFLFI